MVIEAPRGEHGFTSPVSGTSRDGQDLLVHGVCRRGNVCCLICCNMLFYNLLYIQFYNIRYIMRRYFDNVPTINYGVHRRPSNTDRLFSRRASLIHRLPVGSGVDGAGPRDAPWRGTAFLGIRDDHAFQTVAVGEGVRAASFQAVGQENLRQCSASTEGIHVEAQEALGEVHAAQAAAIAECGHPDVGDGFRIEYRTVPGRDHCQLDEEALALYRLRAEEAITGKE